MFFVRFTGCMIGIGLALAIATMANLTIFEMFSIMAFILAVDSLIVKWIAYVYMQQVLKNMPPIDKDKK